MTATTGRDGPEHPGAASAEPIGIVRKIIAGDRHRRTRFHDEKGNRVDGIGLLYSVRAASEVILRIGTGWRPERPWISYRGTAQLDRLIRPEWRAAEFGSGMSTLWLARRVGYLLSIEADPDWYRIVSARLSRMRSDHVRYELRPNLGKEETEPSYADLSDFPDGHFDLIVVDGEHRSKCVHSAVPKLRTGGFLYLDNTDKDMDGGDLRLAEAELLQAVAARAGSHEYFTDFAPSQLAASQGMLAKL